MLTPEQLAKIRQKEATTPASLQRDPFTNYTEGYFHITLNVHDRLPLLGHLAGRTDAIRRAGTASTAKTSTDTPSAIAESADAPHIVLTEVGKAVEDSWKRNPTFYPHVEILEHQVMPEHFHGLIHLLPGNRKHLGQIVAGFMSGCTHGYWDSLGIDWRNMGKSEGGAGSDSGARAPWQDRDRDHTMSKRGPSLFIRGYNDVEAITPEQVEIKREYIRANPERRMLKGENRALFRIIRDNSSSNWHLSAVWKAIIADRTFTYDPAAAKLAYLKVFSRLKKGSALPPKSTSNTGNTHNTANSNNTGNTANSNSTGNTKNSNSTANTQNTNSATAQPPRLLIDYLGNAQLLANPDKVSLICHRKDAYLFERQKAAVMARARAGAVVVSAFISPKEREIRDALVSEQLAYVELTDNGFGEYYKPGGKSFYACAEGWAMQMTCWEYHYEKDLQISREMCMTMNELVRIISKCSDDWWKE